MQRRMFPQDPPTIVFTRDYHHRVHGDLCPGRKLTIQYDAARLPDERSTDNGAPAWTIKVFFKFLEQGPVYSIDMWKETGAIQTKMSNDTAEGTILLCRVDIPNDADHITLWFQNTGKSGAEYWDSKNGQNYIFRFVAQDLQVEAVKVVSDPQKPLSWFRVDVSASFDISSVSVNYRIANDPSPAASMQTMVLGPEPGTGPLGERKWSGTAPVPQNAVVKFSFLYSAWGNDHMDTNNGNDYVTWNGAERDVLAGVLA